MRPVEGGRDGCRRARSARQRLAASIADRYAPRRCASERDDAPKRFMPPIDSAHAEAGYERGGEARSTRRKQACGERRPITFPLAACTGGRTFVDADLSVG